MIQQAKMGDRESVGMLLQRYRPYLEHLTGLRLNGGLRQRVAPADVVQEVLTKMHTSLSDFRGRTEREFTAWLTQILRHALIDIARRHGCDGRDFERDEPLYQQTGATTIWHEPAADSPTPSQQLMQGEQVLRLFAALDLLPQEQQTAVRLRHLEGQSLHQISDEMGKSPAAVAGLIKRGIHALRLKLKDDEP